MFCCFFRLLYIWSDLRLVLLIGRVLWVTQERGRGRVLPNGGLLSSLATPFLPSPPLQPEKIGGLKDGQKKPSLDIQWNELRSDGRSALGSSRSRNHFSSNSTTQKEPRRWGAKCPSELWPGRLETFTENRLKANTAPCNRICVCSDPFSKDG